MSDMTLLDAVNRALFFEMKHDENVVVLGEDVGVNGGVFRATSGLQQEFGVKRVMDTPLAEALISGLAVGMSTQGLRPVMEIQFMGFIFPALEHIICHAARMRNRTRGRLSCPLVLRAPYSGGIRAPEHHSESTEALLTHIPGLRVVVPSSPMRAYGLLLAAIRDPDPVIFLEPKRIYRAVNQPVTEGEALPLDMCFTLREGSDITLVSWGACIPDALAAATTLAAEHDISAEVIDAATLQPLDMETIQNSVAKTGRCVIIHEANKSHGVGAEIAAQLAEKSLLDLQAPICRVTGFDTVVPYFQNENSFLPDQHDIVQAVLKTINFS